jgi:5-hydroxyisourate hydrolase
MKGRLTTHILDTARGCPGANIPITLWSANNGEKILIKTVRTNSDGRTDAPLLANEELIVQVYELVFHVGEYFVQHFENLPRPMFLDQIPICFAVADSNAHYHVPLLVSPWSYSTYRGS